MEAPGLVLFEKIVPLVADCGIVRSDHMGLGIA